MRRTRAVLRLVGLAGVLLAFVACRQSGALPGLPVTPPRPAAVQLGSLWVAPTGLDTNPGTRARPLRQVARAAALAVPGFVVHVAPGRYDAVESGRDGRAGAPISFVSEVRGGARIDGAGAVTAWDNSADWVVIDGFDLTGSTYNGIVTTGSHGSLLRNRVHDITAPSCDRGGAGIVAESYTAVDNDTIGNVVEAVRAPGQCGRVHGIYYQSPHGGRILNNVVVRGSGWGIHLWHNANAVVISNNTVLDNREGGIAVGGSLEGNDVPPGRATGVVVTNNLVVDNGQAGISEIGRVGRNRYANNLVHGNETAGYQLASRSRATGTVKADPQLRDPARGDFRLRGSSPATNAGTSLGAPHDDLDGVPRPQGSGVDIGAFESVR